MRKAALAAVFVLIFMAFACADETVTIATYYPTPFGVYNELSVASRVAIGDLNSDGLYNTVDMAAGAGSLTVAGSVGIGTTTPEAKLDVHGSIIVGIVLSPSCDASHAGMLWRDASQKLHYCYGAAQYQITP